MRRLGLRSAGLLVAWLAAFGVGVALYWLVERPFLRLRDRLDGPLPEDLFFSTPAPAYLDKTNATAIHGALELPGGDVHGDAERMALAMPGGALGARLIEHPPADRDDQAARLGDRDEDVG